jgi:hypothetical protein
MDGLAHLTGPISPSAGGSQNLEIETVGTGKFLLARTVPQIGL